MTKNGTDGKAKTVGKANTMKTGLLTFHYAHHYGAQLQAYALMKSVMRMGVDCEIINYVRNDTIEGNHLFKKGLSTRALLSNINTLMNYGKLKKRFNRFESFANESMKLSKKFYGTYDELYSTYEELIEEAPEYDAYICGSDQIWNPLIFKENTFDPAFFGEFARSGKRIAYAPSFGISSIPEDKREELRRYLMKFDALSVREKQGEKIIRDVAGRDSVTVLDPTLLLTEDDWSRLASAQAYDEPYILCYFITDGRKYSGFVKALSEKYKLPVVSLCGARRVAANTRYAVLDAGPEQFVGLFKNASLVCTDSFHGTVFSINFKKTFYCFEAEHKPDKQDKPDKPDKQDKQDKSVNSRIYNILEKLGLVSRIYSHTMDMQEFRNHIQHEVNSIDYTAVNQILQKERDMSCKYLKEAIFY